MSDFDLVPIDDDDRARCLGSQLRQAFDEVVCEPLPESFADLLRRLD